MGVFWSSASTSRSDREAKRLGPKLMKIYISDLRIVPSVEGRERKKKETSLAAFLPKNTHVEHTVPTFVVKICDRWISVRREHARTRSECGSEARSAELSTSLPTRRCEREVKLVYWHTRPV